MQVHRERLCSSQPQRHPLAGAGWPPPHLCALQLLPVPASPVLCQLACCQSAAQAMQLLSAAVLAAGQAACSNLDCIALLAWLPMPGRCHASHVACRTCPLPCLKAACGSLTQACLCADTTSSSGGSVSSVTTVARDLRNGIEDLLYRYSVVRALLPVLAVPLHGFAVPCSQSGARSDLPLGSGSDHVGPRPCLRCATLCCVHPLTPAVWSIALRA